MIAVSMKVLLVLLALVLQPAVALRRSRHMSRVAVSSLPSDPSPILKDLAARSKVPQYELVILRFAEDLSSWVDKVPLLWR